MRDIRFISTSTIGAANNIDHHNNELMSSRIELTPCDLQHIQIEYIQKGLLFHKPTLFCIQNLKTTLSQTLAIFYPLAGQLVMVQNDDVDGHTKSFFIDCNDSGATFIHAALDGLTIADVVDPLYIPDDVVYSFFPMNGALNYEGVSKPLLAAQVTELDDAVFIALTMNHAVVDGTVFWRFFNTWSEISRLGSDVNIPRLVFGRFYLDGVVDLPIHIPSFDPNDIHKHVVPPLRQRMFHFSKENIAKLKAKANDEMGSITKISSLQALLAHLWVSITRNRNINGDQEVSYEISVGIRQRIEPSLPEGYFGNAILEGMVKSTAGELLEKGLGWASQQMNGMVASQTKERIRRFFEDWAKSPKLADELRPGYRLLTGSSPRFNVYGNDFGWGRPITVRSGPANKFDGKLTVFPGVEEGSVDFEICLRTETLHSMECDTAFLETIA